MSDPQGGVLELDAASRRARLMRGVPVPSGAEVRRYQVRKPSPVRVARTATSAVTPAHESPLPHRLGCAKQRAGELRYVCDVSEFAHLTKNHTQRRSLEPWT